MKFGDFKERFCDSPVIFGRDAVKLAKDPQAMLNQLTRWSKKGLLISLRKGVYLLNTSDRKSYVDQGVIANKLYEPSYLSLEYAFNYYLLIPERVTVTTSVTTRKTMRFRNKLGYFVYQRIKPEAFRGFRMVKDHNFHYFIAEPEKAMVDFFYLNMGKFRGEIRELIEHSHRFQNLELLRKEKITEMAELFGSSKLMRMCEELIKWIEEE